MDTWWGGGEEEEEEDEDEEEEEEENEEEEEEVEEEKEKEKEKENEKKLMSCKENKVYKGSVLSRIQCKRELDRLQDKYVITVVDKAAGNF